MTQTTDNKARVFATPDESGIFAVEDCETVRDLKGMAEIRIVEQADGWRAAATLELPEWSGGVEVSVRDEQFPARGEAVVSACEDIVGWCSTEKGRGSKKHRKAAESVQDWALELEKRELAAAVPVDASAGACGSLGEGPAILHDDLCPRCDRPMIVLETGPRIGEIACAQCDAEEVAAYHAELQAVPQRLVEPIAPGDKPDEQNTEVAATFSISSAPFDPAIASPAPLMIALTDLYESPWNPRLYYPEGPLAELAESMRANGFREWLPLVVRPRMQAELLAGFEIAAGHRRARAARMAGLTHVPCMVREMSDAELLDVLNFDNSGREDVHPLHEAAGWLTWMEKTGGTVSDIAARIGQSPEYVYDHLKCLDLIEEGRKLFLDGAIKPAHARQIARLGAANQRKVLEYLCPAYDPDRQVSTRQLATFIADLNAAEALRREGEALRREGEARQSEAPAVESTPEPEPEPEPTPEPEPAPQAARTSYAEVSDAEREAEATTRDAEKKRKQWEAEQRAINDKALAEQAEKDRKAKARGQLMYRRTVEAICAKANFPASLEATRELCAVVIESLDGGVPCDLAAEMYRIPAKGGVRQRDIEDALYRLPPATLVRITLAAMLLDLGAKMEWSDNTTLILLAGAHKVDRVKIAAAVDAELNPKPAAPAKDARKGVIGKRGTLTANAPAKKSAAPPAAAKKSAPAKKAAAKGKGKK